MSAPTFLQDPPEYNQTIDQMLQTTRSMNEWIAPAEWRTFPEQDPVKTNDTTWSKTGLLTECEQVASRDNFSFPPTRVGRKHSKSKGVGIDSNVNSGSSQKRSTGTTQARLPKISAPIPDTFIKNGIPNSSPPEFSSPVTYYSPESFDRQRTSSTNFRRSSSPGPGSPTKERTIIKFVQHEYPCRSSPQAIWSLYWWGGSALVSLILPLGLISCVATGSSQCV
jgi:hypothetical protein